MNNNNFQQNQNAENNVDVSLFGMNSTVSWIIFAIFIVIGIIFLPYLLNLFL